MRALRTAAALGAGLGLSCAVAGPFDGVYVPNPSGQSADLSGCQSVGIMIAADRVRYFEVSCELSNPVQVREMDALLYDGLCRLDTAQKRGRVLIRRMASGDIAVVTPFMDVRLTACEVAG